MRNGRDAEAFIKSSKDGEELPNWVLDRPELNFWLVDIMSAFMCLSSSRSYHTNGGNPIQLSEINAYFLINEISQYDEKQYYLRLIKALDKILLNHQAEMQLKENKQ